MAESFADDLDWDAVFDEQAAVGVAQIVKSDWRDAGFVNDPHERFVYGVGMDCFAVTVGEHPPVAVRDADRGELGGLERLPTRKDRQGRVVQRDSAAGSLGFATGFVNFIAVGDETAVEVEALLGEVDVGPFQSEYFVASHPVIAVSQYSGNSR